MSWPPRSRKDIVKPKGQHVDFYVNWTSYWVAICFVCPEGTLDHYVVIICLVWNARELTLISLLDTFTVLHVVSATGKCLIHLMCIVLRAFWTKYRLMQSGSGYWGNCYSMVYYAGKSFYIEWFVMDYFKNHASYKQIWLNRVMSLAMWLTNEGRYTGTS